LLKAPDPILREIRGVTYKRITKPVFSVTENPFLRVILFFRWADFCPLGSFFGAIFEGPRKAEKKLLIFRSP
jgi:hypothetical protein